MLNLTQERSFSTELKRIFLCSLEGLYVFLLFECIFTKWWAAWTIDKKPSRKQSSEELKS
jgi:hypothetical protein